MPAVQCELYLSGVAAQSNSTSELELTFSVVRTCITEPEAVNAAGNAKLVGRDEVVRTNDEQISQLNRMVLITRDALCTFLKLVQYQLCKLCSAQAAQACAKASKRGG